MKTQTLLDEKRRTKNRISTTGRNEMNPIRSLMKTCGVPVDEFNQTFPGNSFFDFVDRKRKLERLRVMINK